MVQLHLKFVFLLSLSLKLPLDLLLLLLYFSFSSLLLISALLLVFKSIRSFGQLNVQLLDFELEPVPVITLLVLVSLGPVQLLLFLLIVLLLPVVPDLDLFDDLSQVADALPDLPLGGPDVVDFVAPVLLLVLQGQVLGHQLLPDLHLLLVLLLELVLLVLLPDFYFLQALDGLLLVQVHLELVPGDDVADIVLLLLELLGFVFHLLKVLLDLVGPLQFVFDYLVAGADACLVALDVALVGLALLDVALLGLQVLGQIVIQLLQ